MTPKRKALLAYLAALLTAPVVALTALGGLLASGETLDWELRWAARMQFIAFAVVVAWVGLVALAVRFGVEASVHSFRPSLKHKRLLWRDASLRRRAEPTTAETQRAGP